MKKLIALILCVCMLSSLTSVMIFAAATDITVTSASYYDSNDVKSININFGWDSASASSRLTVMTERFRSAGEAGTHGTYGDFTDLGFYGKAFNSWDAVIAQKDKLGILYYTDEQRMQQGASNTLTLNFNKGDIPLNVDKTYYVYLWTYWGGQYYPDNLFMVLQVKNGQLQYASSKGRNDYGSFNTLKEGALTTNKENTQAANNGNTQNTQTTQPQNTQKENTQTTQKEEKKQIDLTAGGIFERYIPIAQVYGSEFGVGLRMKAGEVIRMNVGTQFNDGVTYGAPHIKRSQHQGHFIKLNYLGTYETIDKNSALVNLGLLKPEEYEKVMKGESSDWATAYNITKDTIVVSVDLYDQNKKFVRTLYPASFIAVVGDDGSFITYSQLYNISSALYFSQMDNLFTPDEDVSNSRKSLTMTTTNLMVTDKSVAEGLLGTVEKTVYNFNKYPALTGSPIYNANHILSDEEFVTPDGTYYQVADEFKKIDPVVKNKITNVVSYSYYPCYIGVGYTQRHVVTADGTLYGITSGYDKKTLATNVKKTTANHYLTKDGSVKEISTNKVIATNCSDFEESNDGWLIGIIKNDGSFHMGYTCIEGGDGYKKGLKNVLNDAKLVVPNGVLDNNNTFYRWDKRITAGEIDMNAFYSGKVVQSYTLDFSLINVCSNVDRIFPYEYLTKVNSSDDDVKKQNIYGFVQTKDGTLYGYSTTYHQAFGSYGKIERIFPLYTGISVNEGNFVGIKVEYEPTPYGIVCRYCDYNTYRWGKLVNEDGSNAGAYVCETQGGYYATDGKVYGTEANPPNSHEKNTSILSATNVITDLPHISRSTATYGAYNRNTNERLPLLPSVYTWFFDRKGITLLERTDGSMWMAVVFSPSSSADLISKLDGYESSNVFQVSSATKTLKNVEYIDAATGKNQSTIKLLFSDVPSAAWYYSSVQWALDKGITSGTSDTTFSPDMTCTRAQILTFLWRAVGSPKMSGSNPFTDVNTTDYFYDAALWASSKGMVTGTTFAGNTPCTRSATVVYLWKNAGSPAAAYNGVFTDVSSGSDYAQAVAWAVNNNITSGMGDNTFAPDMTCTRGQIVTFLQRALK